MIAWGTGIPCADGSCLLAYLITCILHDRLANAGLDPNVNEALDRLARIQRIPVDAGGHVLTKTTRANEQQRAILHAIG